MTPPPKPDPPAPKIPRPTRFPELNKKTLPWFIVGILILLSLFLLGQYHAAQHKLQAGANPVASKEVTNTIAKVRKLIILPADEKPTVATVQHADKLKSQSFFASAQDGDKVIVYRREKQAILYRPSVNQIVTVAPVSLTPNSAQNLTPH